MQNYMNACPKICFHICFVTMYSSRFAGLYFNNISRTGRSVASASEANVSIIKLTHNSCTGVRGDCFITNAQTTVEVTATMLTVS